MTDGAHPAEAAGRPVDAAWFEAWGNRLLSVWNDHDTTVLPELVTEDVTWVDPARPNALQGVDAVRRFMEDSWRGMPDLHFDTAGPNCFAGNEPVVLTPWRMTGTHLGQFDPPGYAPTGRHFDVEGVDRYTFRNGRLAVYRAYYDVQDLAQQIGLLPPPGSRTERTLVVLQRASVNLRRRVLSPRAGRRGRSGPGTP